MTFTVEHGDPRQEQRPMKGVAKGDAKKSVSQPPSGMSGSPITGKTPPNPKCG